MTQSKRKSLARVSSMCTSSGSSGISRSNLGLAMKWLALVTVLLVAGRLSAQVNSATLHGLVTDPTGAAIPGVTITVTNTDNGAERVSQTDRDGQYTIPSLQPGKYVVVAASKGFSAVRQQNLVLEVGQVASLDLSLAIGNASETVTVETSTNSLVDTETTLGNVIPEKEVQDLPLNGRQFSQLLALSPGVVPIDNSQNAGKAPGFGAGAISPSVNGQSNRSNTFFVDGIIDSDPFFGGFSFSPSVDDIQEFKQQSHTDQAEYGLSTGAITSIVTRPGGNTFHGSAFEFLRNTALNTQNKFAVVKQPYHLNQFGGGLGGPILKNKFFFFANYEGGRQVIAGQNFYTVPSLAERDGNFQGPLPGGGTATIYDPSTYNPTTFTETPFANNTVPHGRIDPQMLAYLQATYPLPNFSPTATNANNYTNNIGNTVIGDQGNIRLDYNLGQKDIFSGRYSQNAATISNPGGLDAQFETGFNGRNTGGSWVHTYTPTTVSEFVVAYNSLNIPQAQVTPYSQPAVFAAAGLGAGWNETPGAITEKIIPSISLNGASYTGTSSGFGPIGPSDIIQVTGSLSKQLGNHALKFGGSFYRTALYTNYSGNNVTFSNKATWNAACQYAGTNPTAAAQCPTYNPNAGNLGGGGDAVAALLLSLPIAGTNDLGNSGVNLRQHIVSFFAEDTWAVGRKLTFNYGLRWDYSQPVTETDNRLSAYNIYTHKYFIAKGNVDLPTTPLPSYVVVGPGSTITKPNYTYFQPRLGIAYKILPHTIVRAGAGRDFDLFGLPLQVAQQSRGGWPSGYTQIASTQNLNFAGISTLPNGAPVSGENPFPGPGTLPAAPLPAGGLGFQDAKWQPASSVQWNFVIEQDLGKVGVVTLGYVGSHSEHQTLANPYNVALPSTNPVHDYPDQTLGSPGTDEMSIGSLNYQSFQASYRVNLTQSLVLNTSFTLARTFGLAACLGDFYQSCVQNPNNLRADYGPTDLDIPVIFSLNASYKLPFGKGQPFLTSGIGSAIFGGFQLNTIISARSGEVINPTNGVNADTANVGGGQQRINFLGNPNEGAPHQLGNWFNASAFAAPANGTYGTAGMNSLRGPGYVNEDLSIFRDLTLHDRLKLELRLEAFDLFNHPNLGQPNAAFGQGSFNTITSTVPTSGPGSNRVAQVAAKILF